MNSEKFTSLTKEEKPLFLQLLCLLILARDGPYWCYGIFKKLNEDELPNALLGRRKESFKIYLTTVGRTLNELVSLGLIRKEKRLVKLKKGHPKRMYHITFHGLLYVLEFYEESWMHIDDIAKKHADKLPLIFKQWEYFGRKKVKKEVIQAMRIFCKTYVPYQSTLGKLERINAEFLRENMTRHILFFHLPLVTHPFYLSKASEEVKQNMYERAKRETLEWINIWLDNHRLEKYAKTELNRHEEECVERLTNIKLVKKYIQNREDSAGQSK